MSASRSDLHEHALTEKDITPGRRIVLFNIHNGEVGTFVVVGRRFEHKNGTKLELEAVPSGKKSSYFLSDLGAAPRGDGSFNPENFTVDESDRHTLPTKLVPRKPGDGPGDGYFWHEI